MAEVPVHGPLQLAKTEGLVAVAVSVTLVSLAQLAVHFSNTRDVLPVCPAEAPGERVTCWPAPEYPATVNTTEVGDLGLTPDEEGAIVAFLKALSDAGGRRPRGVSRGEVERPEPSVRLTPSPQSAGWVQPPAPGRADPRASPGHATTGARIVECRDERLAAGVH
jgi:hypothetical protein